MNLSAESSYRSFKCRVEGVKPPKSNINELILDYLTTEGYPTAAAKFSKEANLMPHQEENDIRIRYDIQHSVHAGHIQTALYLINELDPELLDREPTLHSDLLRLQLIELIKSYNSQEDGDILPVLQFASQQLAPRASTNDLYLEDLEKTMALLVFPADQLDSSLKALLEPSLRRTVAENVNASILSRQRYRREAAIRDLVRLRAWAEDTARSHKIDIPTEMTFGFVKKEVCEPAHDPMVTKSIALTKQYSTPSQ